MSVRCTQYTDTEARAVSGTCVCVHVEGGKNTARSRRGGWGVGVVERSVVGWIRSCILSTAEPRQLCRQREPPCQFPGGWSRRLKQEVWGWRHTPSRWWTIWSLRFAHIAIFIFCGLVLGTTMKEHVANPVITNDLNCYSVSREKSTTNPVSCVGAEPFPRQSAVCMHFSRHLHTCML